MRVASLDHLVLTVADVEVSAAFYVRVLGMKRVEFGEGRVALHFGHQKINLHPAAAPLKPHAAMPTRGSADLCFVTPEPLDQWVAHLKAAEVVVEEGLIDSASGSETAPEAPPKGSKSFLGRPGKRFVSRTGARGPMRSLYFRDPDGNLIEIARYG